MHVPQIPSKAANHELWQGGTSIKAGSNHDAAWVNHMQASVGTCFQPCERARGHTGVYCPRHTCMVIMLRSLYTNTEPTGLMRVWFNKLRR